MTYREAVDWLYGLQLYGIKLGLENMRRLCAALGIQLGPAVTQRANAASPEDSLPPSTDRAISEMEAEGATFIHVAGTNGKGSVCAMLASICREAGVRCGLYTSPHLVTFRERIQLDGAMISQADVAAGLTNIRNLVSEWEHSPTFFEVTTALALDWFQEQHAHVVILETGLGGRLDATNVVTPAVSVLTSIGLDHQHVLGNTLAEIAGEKCGIIKPCIPVVTARQDLEAAAVIRKTALATGSQCEWVTEPWPAKVALSGEHQRWNAALAVRAMNIAATRQKFLAVGGETITRALAQTRWPGRFQIVSERVVLDGAHNPSAMEKLAATWRSEFGDIRATVILGIMRDKDVRASIPKLLPIAARVFATSVQNTRSLTPADLASVVRECAPELPVWEYSSLPSALAAARGESEAILVTGSLFLVGEALVELGVVDAAGERSDQ